MIPRVVDELSERNSVTSPPIDDPALAEPSLEGVLVVADLSTEHRDDEDVDYEQVPPLGGPHDPDWLACGAYDEPLRDENAVHDLEHGTVWITYDPDLDEDEVDALEELLPDDGIMSPYPGLPAPVVVSVWGAQLQLDGADDPRLPLFLDELGDGRRRRSRWRRARAAPTTRRAARAPPARTSDLLTAPGEVVRRHGSTRPRPCR